MRGFRQLYFSRLHLRLRHPSLPGQRFQCCAEVGHQHQSHLCRSGSLWHISCRYGVPISLLNTHSPFSQWSFICKACRTESIIRKSPSGPTYRSPLLVRAKSFSAIVVLHLHRRAALPNRGCMRVQIHVDAIECQNALD